MGKLGNIFGGVGNGVNSNPMNMFMQLMNGNMNPQQMMDSMIQQNPQMKQFLTQAQAMTRKKLTRNGTNG